MTHHVETFRMQRCFLLFYGYSSLQVQQLCSLSESFQWKFTLSLNITVSWKTDLQSNVGSLKKQNYEDNDNYWVLVIEIDEFCIDTNLYP